MFTPCRPLLSVVQFNDDQLKWSRLDFIKLADVEQVEAFVQTGYAYAERVDASSECLCLCHPATTAPCHSSSAICQPGCACGC
jgi:hypothetical protein